MNETIHSILEAEEKAERIINDASEKGKAVMLRGEEDAERLKEQAVGEFNAERKDAIAAAEKKAERMRREQWSAAEPAK